MWKTVIFSLWAAAAFSYEFAIAGLFRDEAPYLREWIEYHWMAGADHFWLYNDRSQDGWEAALAPYIEEGLVEVADWPIPDILFYGPFQIAAYEDALRKAQKEGTKWLAFIDIDEFLLPLEGATVLECLNDNFADAAAVFVNWRNFGTGGIYLEPGEPILPNLTACSLKTHSRNAHGKSIVRPALIDEDQVWNPHTFIPREGYSYFNGDGDPIDIEERELLLNGEQHFGYLVLNHYFTKDENFFRSVRQERQKAFGVEPWLTEQLYHDFNRTRDETLLSFVWEKHPQWAKAHWPEEKPFVSARIYGRLGNNLFQVAAASALAWDNGARAIFPDLSSNPESLAHVFFRFDASNLPAKPSLVWNEPAYAYSPIPYFPDMELIGYFQSENHFKKYRERLLHLLSPHPKDLEYIRKKYYWLDEMPDTVGVQLRYYKREFPTESIYPQYGKDYLEKALSSFPASSIFVVSSDAIEYARGSMPAWAENAIFLEGEAPYIDLCVLSLCKHNVISNSSFGWWAAWLNQNPGKEVVCPALWMKDCPASVVCPPEWIQLEAAYD